MSSVRTQTFFLSIAIVATAHAGPLALNPCPPSTLQRYLQLGTQVAVTDLPTLKRMPFLHLSALKAREAEIALAGWKPPTQDTFIPIATGTPEAALEILRKLPSGTTWGIFDKMGEFVIGPAHPDLWTESGQKIPATLVRGKNAYSAQLDWSKVTQILVDKEAFIKRFEIESLRELPLADSKYLPETGNYFAQAGFVQELPIPKYVQLHIQNLEVLTVENFSKTPSFFNLHLTEHFISTDHFLTKDGRWVIHSLPKKKNPKGYGISPANQTHSPFILTINPRVGFFPKESPTYRESWNQNLPEWVQQEGRLITIQTERGFFSGVLILPEKEDSSRFDFGLLHGRSKSAWNGNRISVPTEEIFKNKNVTDWIPGWIPNAEWGSAGRRVATREGIKEVARFEPKPMSPEVFVHFTDGTKISGNQLPYPPQSSGVEFAKLIPEQDRILIRKSSENFSSGGDDWGTDTFYHLRYLRDVQDDQNSMIFSMSELQNPTSRARTSTKSKEYLASGTGDYNVQAHGGSLTSLVEALKSMPSPPLVWIKAFADGRWRLVMPQKTVQTEKFLNLLREKGFFLE